jgi:hypothetical protein
VVDVELANQIDVEWLILADYADIVGGKLYLVGGGWDTYNSATAFPAPVSFAIAASFSVPWGKTNEPHELEFAIHDSDGNELARLNGQIEVGRPAGMRGDAQRFQIAVKLTLGFEKPGQYTIITRVDGEDRKRTGFKLISQP